MKVINRIKKSDDFVKSIKNGHHYRDPSFIVHISKSQSNNTRVGLSVSSKLGNAVIRNRIKRQLRAICDEIIDYQSGYDIIVVAKPAFLDNDFHDNKERLKSLLVSEIGLIK